MEQARQRLELQGRVQGVGFRPHVYRLAQALGLAGRVCNTGTGARVEVQGPPAALALFRERLFAALPAAARVDAWTLAELPLSGEHGFEIVPSERAGAPELTVLPDMAVCGDCLVELFDPADRRYRYPFINCTQCGPRLSIITDLPYDRSATTMAGFSLCRACAAEYADPASRRFHAQPNACPACGPRLEYREGNAGAPHLCEAALQRAVAVLAAGGIVAVKGVGGFHLMADATAEAPVRTLRRRKGRALKPLAVMVRDLAEARRICAVSEAQAQLLAGPAAPIVLLARRDGTLPELLAPGNPDLGVMLAYAPLHHLLLAAVDRPLVATSGNLSDEPICIGNAEALERLAHLADGFLLHDRPIQRPVEDSVVQWAAGRPMVLRAGRGIAPVTLARRRTGTMGLATGAYLKNAPALASARQWIVAAHVGDLDTPQARDALEAAVTDHLRLYGVEPGWVARDRHPDYPSSELAERWRPAPIHPVQHHHAHVAAVMAEHALQGPVLGVAWDGVGLGDDGTAWGGECLVVDDGGYRRLAGLRPFPLPGGDRAARAPWRCALGLLHAAGQPLPPAAALGCTEALRDGVAQALAAGVNSPATSSMGRLFDAVASLLGLCQVCDYEAQAAMAVQFQAETVSEAAAYPMPLVDDGALWRLDWAPMLLHLLADRRAGRSTAQIAARFHNTLAVALVAVAERAGLQRVVLGGGCFQNRQLLAVTVAQLRAAGYAVYWPHRVPPGDGGIALGQLAAAAAREAGDVSGGTG